MLATFALSMIGIDDLDIYSHVALPVQEIAYGICLVAMITMEAQRPFGSVMASGIMPTSRSPLLLLIGMCWAFVSVMVIYFFAKSLGGTFTALPLSIEVSTIFAVIIFAVGEEVLFRGTIFRALEERFGSTAAVLVTSGPFALVHIYKPGSSLTSAINVFLAGAALGISVAVTRSLWMAIGFHVLWNVGVALVFGIVSGMDLPLNFTSLDTAAIAQSTRWLVEGPFGVEDGLVTSILLVVSMIMMTKLDTFDPYVQAARNRQRYFIPS